MSVCMYAFQRLVYFLFHHLHITAQTSCSSRGCRPPSQLQQQHHRSLHKTSSARTEIIMAVKQSHFERLLVPSRSPGHSLCLHLKTSQPWPPFPASFAEYSFCFVQVVAGGGGGAVVRSSYSQKGRSIPRKYYHGEHMCSKGWESFGVLDYICKGNETEQKLSNIKLFKCIPHVLNTAFLPRG